METATTAQDAAAPTQGVTRNGKASRDRNVRYPIKLQINITPQMNESLRRVAHHFDMPEGMVGRMALKQYLLSQDPVFRQQCQAPLDE